MVLAKVSRSAESEQILPEFAQTCIALDNPIFLNIFLRQLNAFKTSPFQHKIEFTPGAVEKISASFLLCAHHRCGSANRGANADSSLRPQWI